MIVINKDFPPNINPELYSIIGSITGIILENDFNAMELNSLGNWIILVGQFMLTTAAQQQLINARYQNNTGSKIRSHTHNHHINNKEKVNNEDFQIIINIINNLINEVEKIKKTQL